MGRAPGWLGVWLFLLRHLKGLGPQSQEFYAFWSICGSEKIDFILRKPGQIQFSIVSMSSRISRHDFGTAHPKHGSTNSCPILNHPHLLIHSSQNQHVERLLPIQFRTHRIVIGCPVLPVPEGFFRSRKTRPPPDQDFDSLASIFGRNRSDASNKNLASTKLSAEASNRQLTTSHRLPATSN